MRKQNLMKNDGRTRRCNGQAGSAVFRNPALQSSSQINQSSVLQTPLAAELNVSLKKEKVMSGILELDVLLKNMHPHLSDEEYVFCTIQSSNIESIRTLNPICTFKEDEGLTVVLEKASALKANLQFHEVFKKITLQVHSSLESVGLTAAVSNALASKDISANIIAAYYHDHIFVPSGKSEIALNVLKSFSKN